MEKIDILLATYNGENYIENQLLSIIGQTYKDWNLIIHDDGSTDETVAIIKKWIGIDSRIQIIEDEITKLGAAQNFMHLMQYSNSEFVCFCDQDDIWFENKLELSFNAIKDKDNNREQVVFSNAYAWSANRGIINNRSTFSYPTQIKDLLFLNGGIQGAAAIFNKSMKNYIDVQYETVGMHDHFLTLAGVVTNGIDYIDKQLLLYRQHELSVTNMISHSFSEKINNAIKNRDRYGVIDRRHYYALKNFLDINRKTLPDKDIKTIEIFLQFPFQNKLMVIINVLKYRFTYYNSTIKLIIKIIWKPLFK